MKIFLALLPLPLAAQIELDPDPAAIVRFPSKEGAFYVVEALEGEKWQQVDQPVKGTGKTITRTIPLSPQSKLRATQLHNQWVPVWADEFDGDTIDPAKWSHEENGYGGGNNERQYYSTDPKYSFVKDGMLNLKAYKDPFTTVDGKVSPYTSARLRTLYRGDWKYGKFEVRAKLPSGEAIWPAIWMLPTNSPYGGWASGGEIDIMESRGKDVHMTFGTLHFGAPWPDNVHKGQTFDFPEKNAAEDFHTYTVEWKKDDISWFLDGKKWQTINKEDWWSSADRESLTAPFDQPFHLIINLAVGGDNFFEGTGQLPINMKDSEFPQTMLIDYVRVSQWAE
ncbi:MAG: glycoside hydrolase family 16 protein [Verrucomicrobiaceae bacterium]